MTTLFQLAAEVRAATACEELDDAAVERLEALGLDLDRKVDAYCALIREAGAREAARQAEIDRLKSANEADANFAKRLKQRLQEAFAVMGVKGHKTALFSVHVQASPPTARCIDFDPAKLDERFVRIIPARAEPNNRAAIEYWQETGLQPDGFEVVQSQHLRIR